MHEHVKKNVIFLVTQEVSGLSNIRIEVSTDGKLCYFHCTKDGRMRVIAVDLVDPYAYLITGNNRNEFSIAAEIIYELRH